MTKPKPKSILDTFNAEQTAEITKMRDAMQPELGKIVDSIEKKPMTTRGHYGDYMSAFAQIRLNTNKKADVTMRNLVGLAMIMLGANERGVLDAMKVLS